MKLRQVNPEVWGGNMVSTIRQDDPRRIAFLIAHGFRFKGEFAGADLLQQAG
jgi:hypothetical protein